MTNDALQMLTTLPAWADLLMKLTLLLGALWTCHFALRRANPRWRVLVWRGGFAGIAALALAALLAPAIQVSVAAPARSADVAIVTPPWDVTDNSIVALDLRDDVTLMNEIVLEESSIQPVIDVDEPVTGAVTSGAASAPVSRISLMTAFAAIWLGGALVLLFRLAGSWRALCRTVGSSRPASPEQQKHLAELCAARGVRTSVRLRISPRVGSPAVAGCLRPVILLPERFESCAANDDLTAVLVHELSHLEQGDLRWSLGFELLFCALWFHPLAWGIGRAHRASCEAVADHEAALAVGSRERYASVLADIALRLSDSHSGDALVLSMARRANVRRRIDDLYRRATSRRLGRVSVAAAVAIGLSGVFVLGTAQLVIAEGETKPAAPMAPEAPGLSAAPNPFNGGPDPFNADDNHFEPMYGMFGQPGFPSMSMELLEAHSRWSAAEADLRAAQALLEGIRKNHELRKEQFEVGRVSQDQLNSAKAEWEAQQARVDAAHARAREREARLRLVQSMQAGGFPSGTGGEAASVPLPVRGSRSALHEAPGLDAATFRIRASVPDEMKSMPEETLIEVIETILYGADGKEQAAAHGRRMWYNNGAGTITVTDGADNINRVRLFLETIPELAAMGSQPNPLSTPPETSPHFNVTEEFSIGSLVRLGDYEVTLGSVRGTPGMGGNLVHIHAAEIRVQERIGDRSSRSHSLVIASGRSGRVGDLVITVKELPDESDRAVLNLRYQPLELREQTGEAGGMFSGEGMGMAF